MTLQQIMTDLVEAYGYKFDVKSRKRTFLYPRYIFMQIAKDYGFYLKDIGDFLHGKDHTTVINGLCVYKDLKEVQDQEFLRYLEKVPKSLLKESIGTEFTIEQTIKMPIIRKVSVMAMNN